MFSTSQVATTYDQIALNFSATRPKLLAEASKLIPHLPPHAQVLDLGCGNGVLLNHLRSAGSEPAYLGIDISPAMIKEATGLNPVGEFVIADISQSQTWRNLGQYDLIAALAVLHHLPENHLKVLQNIKQHLKPSGTVLISIWRLDQPRFDRFRQGKFLTIPFHNGPTRDFYCLSPDELISLVEKTGLVIQQRLSTKDNFYLTASL